MEGWVEVGGGTGSGESRVMEEARREPWRRIPEARYLELREPRECLSRWLHELRGDYDQRSSSIVLVQVL